MFLLRPHAFACFVVAGLTAGTPVQAQTVSASKLGAHLIDSYTAGASNIAAGHPRVLKILDLGPGMLQAARAYKAGTPGGKLVLRLYTSKSYTLAADPASSGSNFWATVLKPPLDGLSAPDRGLIDYVEGPNEGDSTPAWQSAQTAQWLSDFWRSLAPLIAGAGFKPCIGSIPVGNPPDIPGQIAAFVPALRVAKSLGGAWSYHAYTINYTTDTGVEYYYSLRYRQFYSLFASQFPDLVSMPLILTEGGVDQSGAPATSGWRARGVAADYERWLNWFDGQISQDPYVIGCSLFEIGNPAGWSSFDLEPVAGWMGSYLATPASAPAAPTGLSGVATNGGAVLAWTSAPASPTVYRVKRSTSPGGPYTVIATNVTEGVKATTFADSTVAGGSLYYYAVSAVNAAGEGPNSSQVSVSPPNLNLPDLIVTAVNWVPSPAFAGNNLVFRATVKNQGAGPTPAGIVLGVGFSVDGGPETTWSASRTAALAPGASVTLSADGGLNGKSVWTAVAGPHTVTATANDIFRFPESNESNNALTASLPIPAGPPKMNGFGLGASGAAGFSFSATPGLSYRVEYKNDLAAAQWSNLVDVVARSNAVQISDPLGPAPRRFYRVAE